MNSYKEKLWIDLPREIVTSLDSVISKHAWHSYLKQVGILRSLRSKVHAVRDELRLFVIDRKNGFK